MKDYLGYQGKVCVVTGAANGMGKAAVEILVDLGADVYALDHVTATTPGTSFVDIHLGDRKSIDVAFSMLPSKIDNYFGVAGVSGMKHNFVQTVEINYLANKYIIEKYLMDGRMGAGGVIAIITSMGGYRWERLVCDYAELVQAKSWDDAVEAIKDWPVELDAIKYGISKMAMNYYNIHMVKPLALLGIRINSLLAGSTATQLRSEFDNGMMQLMGNLSGQQKGTGARLAEPREMAEPMIFLGSQMASFVSGQQLCVDNGSAGMIEANDLPDIFSASKLLTQFKRLSR